jgi:hypothetical protein
MEELSGVPSRMRLDVWSVVEELDGPSVTDESVRVGSDRLGRKRGSDRCHDRPCHITGSIAVIRDACRPLGKLGVVARVAGLQGGCGAGMQPSALGIEQVGFDGLGHERVTESIAFVASRDEEPGADRVADRL